MDEIDKLILKELDKNARISTGFRQKVDSF